MGVRGEAEIDGWLRDGGLVVAASDRAARALQTAFHRRRRAEGLAAWPAPDIQDWRSFARAAWEERALDGRMMMNPAQEKALWADIVGREKHIATLLEGPRLRLAGMAMEAHELLCAYAPRYLKQMERSGWSQDAGAFSGWLSAFDESCETHGLLSPARALLELTALLQADSAPRRPLLAAGFDRLLPAQRALFDAWGAWQERSKGEPARDARFYTACDDKTELEACALWCSRQLSANPHARLLVITQDISSRRGEIERAFLRHGAHGAAPLFEFSLGIPLSRQGVARAAHLLLRWLDGALAENELDWLFSTALAANGPEDSDALQAFIRALRRHGLERTEWTLGAFLGQRAGAHALPAAWVARMIGARQRLMESRSRRQSPLDWAGLVPQLLQDIGLPGNHTLSSADYQAFRRWGQAVDACGSLGFDGRRIGWTDFLSALARTLDETLFAPESSDAPIQIAGPAESAGLAADAIWFLGADEEAWPAAALTHPLLPPQVQRQAGMPHATPRNDWELAQAITTRLLAAAPVVHFSCPMQKEGTETRPSRLIAQLAGPPQPLPVEPAAPSSQPRLTVPFQDASRVPFFATAVRGGAGVLTDQSQCPFKAFATARLGARGWEPAEAGLTAKQRGQLLHSVLHRVWGGAPDGIRTHEDLARVPDRRAFVAGHVRSILREEMPAGSRERMPRRYLELEELRLVQVVAEWLEFELARLPFAVDETEAEHPINLAGLALQLRLDRIDRLNDGSVLVIDYKTGDVSPKAWELPRPDDVQLPLYAGFALQEEPGGLVFASVRSREASFSGFMKNAKATLFDHLKGNTALAKSRLTSQQMKEWKQYIEQLARSFVAGRADVNPREYPQTCERCGLQTVCRVQEEENMARLEAWDGAGEGDESGNEEASDE
ncbi:MAG: PD-(D/E)XK nuclease family protein [Acidobacteriota bacterium]|nr:PD-(D/E)XK nuclease family protein [Acidobacteriota bacterium]